jgi:hypothetical protein
MRKFINQYGYIIAIAAVVISLIVIIFSMRGGSAPQVPTQAFYMDEETGEESLGDINGIPPLMGKNGKATLVKVLKYSCDGGKTKTPYLLIKYPPQVQQKLNSLSADDPVQDIERAKLMDDGYWVRSPASGSQWFPAQHPKGAELAVVPNCPDGKPGQIVFP